MNHFNKIKILFILFACCILSCKAPVKNGYQKFWYKDFKIKKVTNSQVVHIDSLVQGMDICVIPPKNLLLVLDIKDKYYIKAYDLTTLKYLKSFIPKGAGLNQQLSCRSIQYTGNGLFYTSDTYKKKIFIYNINDVVKPNTQVIPIDEININNKFFFRPLVLPGNLELQFHRIVDGKKTPVFDYFDKSGTFLYSKGTYPMFISDVDFDVLNYAYLAGISLSEDGENLAVDYYNIDLLALYGINGNLIKIVQGPDNLSPEIKLEKILGGTMAHLSGNSYRGYTGRVKFSTNSLYVLYNGKIASDPNFHVDKLFSFNKQLQPKNYYQLPVPIYAFDIDKKSHIIYCLSTANKAGNLIKFNIE